MNLADWLTHLEGLHPKEIDLGLTRIKHVAEKLDLLSPNAKIITVAGTNGKGSCVATMESLLVAHDQRVGAFTSPHLVRFNERIRINGHEANDDEICEAFSIIDRARADTSLTYFEFNALAALVLFKKHSLDYYLLEVGLGGRLDAVNILSADIAVITNIALDHTAWLGDSREKIAREKAGILRTHSQVACAERDIPKSLREALDTIATPVNYIGKQFGIELPSGDHGGVALQFFWQGTDEKATLPLTIAPKLPHDSVAAGLQALALAGCELQRNTAVNVLQRLYLRGRFHQIYVNQRQVILDVAHNPAAAQKLAESLNSEAVKQCDALIAMMADKDIENTLRPMIGVVRYWHLYEDSSIARSATVAHLEQVLLSLGVDEKHIFVSHNVRTQLEDSLNDCPLVVFGTFLVVAEVYNYIDFIQS